MRFDWLGLTEQERSAIVRRMKPAPKDWPRLSPSVYYDDPRAAIDWLQKAFGFEVRLLVDGKDGSVEHSELTFGESVLMISGTARGGLSPKKAGGYTSALFVYVDDADAHHDRSKAAGATITRELTTTDYGEGYWIDRGYGCTDLEGHSWFFAHRVSDTSTKK